MPLVVTDPVSGVQAPLNIRTMAGHNRSPFFILVGDKSADADNRNELYDIDARSLAHAFYENLPSRTYESLFRLMCVAYFKGEIAGSLTAHEKDALGEVISMLDRNRAPDATLTPGMDWAEMPGDGDDGTGE